MYSETYNTIPFRSVTECKRVMKSTMDAKSKLKPERLISNCLNATKMNQYPVVYFFYAPLDEDRLSDEEFREMFYHLTDSYIEEVGENLDPIYLLSTLCETQNTDVTLGRVVGVLKAILKTDDNEIRAELLRPLFNRLCKKDMHILLLRLSGRDNKVRLRHIVAALADANGSLFHEVKRAILLHGVHKVCQVLSSGEGLHNLIKPHYGTGIVIPSPAFIDDAILAPFGECYIETPMGEWMTLHVLEDAKRPMLFNSSGIEVDVEVSTETLCSDWPSGIYLMEYAANRDVELQICDILRIDEEGYENYTSMPFEQRREYITANFRDYEYKSMVKIENPTTALMHMTKTIEGDTIQTVLLRNANGLLTYENTRYELLLVTLEHSPYQTFRLNGGVLTSTVKGARSKLIGKWKVSVRDGPAYYDVGMLEASPDVEKRLRKLINADNLYEDDYVTLKHPVFVDVNVIASGWGDYGAYVQGTIVSINSKAGIGDCVGIHEIESLTGLGGANDGGQG